MGRLDSVTGQVVTRRAKTIGLAMPGRPLRISALPPLRLRASLWRWIRDPSAGVRMSWQCARCKRPAGRFPVPASDHYPQGSGRAPGWGCPPAHPTDAVAKGCLVDRSDRDTRAVDASGGHPVCIAGQRILGAQLRRILTSYRLQPAHRGVQRMSVSDSGLCIQRPLAT